MWKLFKKKDKKKEPARDRAGAAASEPAAVRPDGQDGKTRPHRAYAVLVKPVVSEKGAHSSIYDTYAFVVKREANKIEVAKAFWALYNVKPLAVRTALMPAKSKRAGRGRALGRRPVWKKALIRVSKGSKVDIFAGV